MIENNVDREKIALHIKKISKKAQRRSLYKSRVFNCCPICGSQRYIKYGFFNKIQRYKCKECEKTFSKATNSICFYSKKSTKTWLDFIKLFNERRTLRYCAKELKISLVTAFYWRHKILHALSKTSTPDILRGVVHVGKTILKENFKGNRKLRFENAGLDNKMAQRKDIWVIAARGDDDSMFANPTLENRWDYRIFNEKVYSKIDKKSYIVSYGDNFLKGVANRHNKKRKLETNVEERIKFIHFNIRRWFSNYHGVASKYLKRYLSFFVLFNLDKSYDYIDLMYDDLIHGCKFLKTENIKIIESNV